MGAPWLLEQFSNGLTASIAGFAGSAPAASTELLPSAPPPAAVPCFQWQQPFKDLPGEIYARASEPDTLALGQLLLTCAGIPDSSPSELRSTFRECIGQAFSVLARSLSSKLQRDITAEAGQEIDGIPDGLEWGAVQIALENQTVPLHLAVSSKFLEALTPPKAAAAAAGSPDPAPIELTTRAPVNDSQTFDLLLDVELPVSVSFGHAQVPLRDVLKLTTGSIVELDRAIVEPVDIVVNNCIIAKGEVVVVEGNFGVRIQHVVSRTERLRTLP